MNNIQDKRFDSSSLYDIYSVSIQITERICGGVPRNTDLIKIWVESTTGHKDEQSDKLAAEDAELILNDVADKCWIGFMEDEKGVFIQARQIKACLKQSATVLGITKKKRGSKQILAEGMEVKSADGSNRFHLAEEISGTHECAIHIMTPQGPRSALRRMDYVIKPQIDFEVWLLKTQAAETRHIGEAELIDILRHAQENGLGASRSQGEGKFVVVGFNKK
jgi:hypothetical protein